MQNNIVIHTSPGIEWQGRYARHAVAGFKRFGLDAKIVHTNQPVPCDIAVIMGPNMYIPIENSGVPYLMFNRKFVGNDPQTVHENCAVSWNGFNGRGTFCVSEVDPTRLERYISLDEIEDWKPKGIHYLLCEQSNVGRATQFQNINQFYNKVVADAHPHPMRLRKKPAGEDAIKYKSLRDGLVDTRAVITLNSTISIEAMMMGYPVISYDISDPVYPISGHSINEIVYPDNRLELFQYMAHCQWTETEIANGDMWETLQNKTGPTLSEWNGND